MEEDLSKGWEPLEAAARERIEALETSYKKRGWPYFVDLIEDIDLDFDEGGAYLTLEGDFVYSMLKYLVNNDESDKSFNQITLKLSSDLYYKLKEKVRA